MHGFRRIITDSNGKKSFQKVSVTIEKYRIKSLTVTAKTAVDVTFYYDTGFVTVTE